MKKPKPIVFVIIIVVLTIVGMFAYRNFYLKTLTEANLGELVSSVKDGKIRDYHNTIGVSDISDVHYVKDDLFGVYRLYYGNYTIYLAAEEASSWSPYALSEYLNKIGISFEEADEQLIFYYYGKELSTVME